MNSTVTLNLPGVEEPWRYGLAYWSGTLGNLLTTHRFHARRPQRYGADVRVSDRLSERWHRLFDVQPQDAGSVPLLYNQSVGTLLYTRLFADLGINFRHLLHVRHDIEHVAGVGAFASARRQWLDCGVRQLSRLGDNKALVDLETRVHDARGALLAVVQDRFLIRKLPARDLTNLDADSSAVREMHVLRRRASELTPWQKDIRCCAMTVPHNMGLAYGRVSGDMNPVHIARLGARLFGVPKPFLQGLGLRNLVIRHLVGMGVPTDHLTMTFASPVYLGQTLMLLVGDGCFEVQDSRQQMVAYGVACSIGQTASPQRQAESTSTSPVLGTDSRAADF